MLIGELLFYASLLFCSFSLILLPLGGLVAANTAPQLNKSCHILVSFGISLLIWSLLVALFFTFGLSNGLIAFVGLLLLIIFLFFWLRAGYQRELRPHLLGFIFCYLFYLFCVAAAAFPLGDLRDVSADTIGMLSGLPIDNLIPYNVSRYLVEGIDPAQIEAVPNWQATDRGPLAGLITAFVFVLLLLSEKAHWLSTSPGTYFVYHCLLVYLNSLCLLAVWIIADQLYGKRSAACAALLVSSTYFFFVNVFFSWPKFLMAYFVLCASLLVVLDQGKIRHWVLAGVLIGGGILAHEIGFFYAASFFAVFALSSLYEKTSKQSLEKRVFPELADFRRVMFRIGAALFGLVATLSPWTIYKVFSGTNSSRLLYLHLFCVKELDVENLSFAGALGRYLELNSFSDLFLVRLNNLLYPFNLFHPLPGLDGYWFKPYAIASVLAHFSFYQLVFALGLPLLALLVVALFQGILWSRMGLLVAVGYGALLPAVLLFGCPLSTWNHTWSYGAFAISVIPAAQVVARGALWSSLLFALAIGTNVLIFVLNFWFKGELAVYLHASGAYGLTQLSLFLSLMAVAVLALYFDAQGTETNLKGGRE